ncbi:complex I subunit 4 family protein [Actinoplanes derwentensis]|uniref:NADH dehydrogenase subunit M n=1 Tax=Actinoplanes derwentensis TaxID=113562 RepID=A0A1H2CLR2_9ACTN|nr:NADH-quinone oxidoreductase subunit M [Actinoplanes derwentensis]GID86136.1 NADH-quinone oxidoreductase subunit M [Actinoplanes derwentensis]SDT71485.1 NADH dehydrogenase subunit M [Actinoplanes derwentensis]
MYRDYLEPAWGLPQVLLIALLVVPLLGAGVVALYPAARDRQARIVATGFATVTFLIALALVSFRPWDVGWFYPPGLLPWAQVDLDWVPALGLDFHLGVDGISYPLIVLTGLLTALCCAYTIKKVPVGGAGRSLAALLLVLEVGVLGTFLAFDLILFFLFFEVVLLPMYAVIAGWGGPRRRAAARKFVLYTLVGSVLLLLGVLIVVTQSGTGDLVVLTGAIDLNRNTQYAVFALLAVAFAIKAPLWPLHTWLPDAHTEAPTVGSVILAGVLLKMGTYGLIRVGVGVAPLGAAWAAPVLGILAVIAIIAGALICLRQTELKRLIAYSSVGHMGFVLLGIATLSVTGIQAALIGNIAHGLITGLLFFLAGTIKDRTGTGSLNQLSGLRETSPRLAGLFGFAAIASLGLPGLAGFWGEAFAVVAAVQRGGPLWSTLATIAAVGGALTAAYFLRLLRRLTHGLPTPEVRALDPTSYEAHVLLPSVAPTAPVVPRPAIFDYSAPLLFTKVAPAEVPTAPARPVVADAAPELSWAEWLAWAPLVLLTLAVGVLPALIITDTLAPLTTLLGVHR